MEKKNEYGYSIGKMEAAHLNADKSLPSPNDWEDTNPQTGEVRKHRGGLVGKIGPFNIDGWTGDDLKLTVLYGTKTETFTFASTAADKKVVSVADMAKDFNTAFTALEAKGIKLKAAKTTVGADYDAEYLKITTKAAGDLPFFAPIGFQGKLAELLGIVGYVSTKEAKSFKDDFDKESGKTVDATSGHGIRCTVKEANKRYQYNRFFCKPIKYVFCPCYWQHVQRGNRRAVYRQYRKPAACYLPLFCRAVRKRAKYKRQLCPR